MAGARRSAINAIGSTTFASNDDYTAHPMWVPVAVSDP
jgi:hypothetical protein